MPFTTLNQDIVLFDRLYQLPSPLQVKNGVDMNNFKPFSSGQVSVKANQYVSVTVSGVSTNTTFAMFAVLYTKDGNDDLFSLKEETVQLVVQTLRRFFVTLSSWGVPSQLANKCQIFSAPSIAYCVVPLIHLIF